MIFEPNNKLSECRKEVINNNNDVVQACSRIASTVDAMSCKSHAKTFIKLYPSIQCRAQKIKTGKKFVINNSDFKKLVAKLTELGY